MWVIQLLLLLLQNMMIKLCTCYCCLSLLAFESYENNSKGTNIWRWWLFFGYIVFVDDAIIEKWTIDLPTIMCMTNRNCQSFGVVGNTFHTIFACVIFGSSNIQHSWFTYWNWKNFQYWWCCHTSSMVLVSNWQLGFIHAHY
jgi:hypothetical protein